MKLTYQPFELELKYPFTIAGFSRRSTPLMLINISYEGFTGYGEASMVPYMGESLVTATEFLRKVDVSRFKYPFNFDEILAYLDDLSAGNPAIKAAIDIALHDLSGKLEQKPCYQFFGSQPENMPATTCTIGMDKPEVIIKKVREAQEFKILKVKLGSDDDKKLVETIRSVSDSPLYVDANQGWHDREKSLDLIYWLRDQGVVLIEQPMKKSDKAGNAWLTARSPLKIIGDEAVQRIGDIDEAAGIYHGINIKLMKSAGMHEAYKMIVKARSLNLGVFIGCMSETSCATLAGAALAPLCDWADLDGPFLVKNNPYPKPAFEDGRYILSEDPGLGLAINKG